MNENSLRAYAHILPELSDRQKAVMDAIHRMKLTGATINEVADLMHVTPNTISGRFGELRDKGAIVEARTSDGKIKKRESMAGVGCTVWVIRLPEIKEPEQLQLF